MLAELSPNQSVPVLDGDTNVGGVIDRKDLSQSLKQVYRTTELRDGRVPTICETAPSDKHKLGILESGRICYYCTVCPSKYNSKELLQLFYFTESYIPTDIFSHITN